MNRPDSFDFLKQVKFGFIPAGTSNGLHKSVVESNKELAGIHSAAFSIAKGKTMRMDLTELELEYF